MRKAVAFIWLTIVVGVCSFAWHKGPSFESSIMALLPQSEQSPYSADAMQSQSNAMGQIFTLMVQHQDEQQARTAALKIRSIFAGSNVLHEQSPARIQQQPVDPKFRFSILSLPVQQRLENGQWEQQSNIALGQLFNPIASAPIDLKADPFGLYGSYLQDSILHSNLKTQQGLFRLLATSKPCYALIYRLSENAFSLSTQSQLAPLFEQVKEYANVHNVTIKMSGLVIHASHGASQAKQEISTIGIGSILGIVLLILVTFRRLKPLIYILLPVSIGAAVALAITTLIFPSVHLITFAFGAGLVGVAVDYSMHYVCAQSGQTKNRLTRALFVGLLLGLISSVLAYAGLALTPFPGLRQIAVFASLGLIASWLTVLFWLPLATDLSKMPLHPSVFDVCQHFTPNCTPKRRQQATFAAVGLSIIGTLVIYSAFAKDDLDTLQTSPVELLKEDRAVQQALGNGYQSAFLLITATSIELLLQKEEQLRLTLDRLRHQGYIGNYQSISQTLPSQAQQRRNIELVRQLYYSQLDTLMDKVGASDTVKQQALQSFTHNQTLLRLPEWKASPLGQLLSNQLIQHSDGHISSVVRIQGTFNEAAKKQLQELANKTDLIEFVDPVADINSTLARYRTQLTACLVIAYLAVSGVLLLRYRKQLWQIILPPLSASIVAFALATLLNGGYNLFNIVALMLVFGIGLDMGIFIKESHGSAHTWVAVSLSTLTSLLAFGLLVLSETPVLYHFGIIVLPGLLFVWLLTPLIQPISYGESRNA